MKYRVIFYDAENNLHDIKSDLSVSGALREVREWFEDRPTPWSNGCLTVKIEEHT